MARQGASAELNLGRNILLLIGLFNICFYAFVLKTTPESLPKMLVAQNEAMPEEKRMSPEVLGEKTTIALVHAKKNGIASIIAGAIILVMAFLLPYSPVLFGLGAFLAFLASLAHQFYLGFDVLLEGLLLKVVCIFGFFQVVRYAMNHEMGRSQLSPETGVTFPKPDEE